MTSSWDQEAHTRRFLLFDVSACCTMRASCCLKVLCQDRHLKGEGERESQMQGHWIDSLDLNKSKAIGASHVVICEIWILGWWAVTYKITWMEIRPLERWREAAWFLHCLIRALGFDPRSLSNLLCEIQVLPLWNVISSSVIPALLISPVCCENEMWC